MTTQKSNTDHERLRWELILPLVGVGLALLIWGRFAAEGSDLWVYLSGVFVNVGTALLLASLLVWFERNFVVSIRRDRQEAVEQAAVSAAAETAKSFTSRFDDIDARVSGLAAARADNTANVVAAFGEELSYESAKEGLKAAAAVRAIPRWLTNVSGWIIVSAGSEPESPLIRFAWHDEHSHAGEVVYSEVLKVGYVPDHAVTPTAEIKWSSGATAAEMVHELQQAMVTVGEAGAARVLNNSAAALFRALQMALDQALRSRNADSGHLFGPNELFEYLWNGWAVTSIGLELPGASLLAVSRDYYPEHFRSTLQTPAPHSKPDWVDADASTWLRAESRVRAHFLYAARRELEDF